MRPTNWFQRSKKDRAKIKAYTLEKAALIRSLKNGPCKDCKQQFPPESMDFDHVPGRGGKLGNVSRRKTLDQIISESRKCDLVCANCHRVRTKKRALGQRLERANRWSEIDAISDIVERERQALKNLPEERETVFNQYDQKLPTSKIPTPMVARIHKRLSPHFS